VLVWGSVWGFCSEGNSSGSGLGSTEVDELSSVCSVSEVDGLPSDGSVLSRVDELPLVCLVLEVDELPSNGSVLSRVNGLSLDSSTGVRKLSPVSSESESVKIPYLFDVLEDSRGVLGFWGSGCLSLDRLARVVQLDLML